jgi:mannose-6-phosphate isomerase
MYDYGRPRELHVEQALNVMKLQTAAGKAQPRKLDGFVRLIEQKYFVVDRYEVEVGREAAISIAEAGCLVGLNGSARVETEGAETVELLPGQAVVVPATAGEVVLRSEAGTSFVRCWAP